MWHAEFLAVLWPIAMSWWLLAIFYGCHPRVGRYSVSAGIMAALFIFSCMTSLTNVLQAVALAVTATVLPTNIKPRTHLKIGIGVTVAVYLVMLLPGAWELIQRHRSRQQYPIQSLADRLSYEAATLDDPTTTFASANQRHKNNSHLVAERLAKAKADNEWFSSRGHELRVLHKHDMALYILFDGLGIGGMIWWPRHHVDAIKLQQLAPLPDGNDGSFDVPVEKIDAEPLVVPDHAKLLGLHDKGCINFLNPDSLGYVAGKQHAAGFIAHRFNTPLPALQTQNSQRTWTIVRLELVSLLKDKQPRVYVSRQLPQLDKLKNAPTRALDEFEEEALDKLWHNEDIVIANESNSIQMLGSLRAQEHCLDCHAVQHGQLLGAFSYELRLRQVMPQPR